MNKIKMKQEDEHQQTEDIVGDTTLLYVLGALFLLVQLCINMNQSFC